MESVIEEVVVWDGDDCCPFHVPFCHHNLLFCLLGAVGPCIVQGRLGNILAIAGVDLPFLVLAFCRDGTSVPS